MTEHVDPIETRFQHIEIRLTALEIGQKWRVWIAGMTLALIVGNFSVTIATALHL